MSTAVPDRRARPGIGTAAAVWFGSVAASMVAFQIVVAVSGRSGDATDSLPFWLHPTLSLVTLWAPILGALWWVHRRFLAGTFTQAYGIRFAWVDLLGIPVGVACQLLVLRVLYWPLSHWFPSTFSRDDVERSARQLTERADGAWKIVLVLAVVIGAPFVEELLYRALILGSLESRIGRGAGLVVGALWFALAHFQGVQFVGLLAFGLVLGACWQRTGRIGLGVLAHAAFNATSLVLLWPKH
jgi:hypothetical protein